MAHCFNEQCTHYNITRISQCDRFEEDRVRNCDEAWVLRPIKKISDPVDHPDHYQTSCIECIDAIEAAIEGLNPTEAFLVGTAIKYLWRFKKKGKPVEDLQKAKWYIDRLIEEEINEQ